MIMKRKLALALLAITLLVFAAAPAYAKTEDRLRPVDPVSLYLPEPDLEEDSGLHLNGNINDYYDYTWEKNDDGADTYTLTLTCKETNEISIFGYCNEWYQENKDRISRVIINTGATTIGNYSFYDCRSLRSVTMPNTITKIGKCAFYNCACLNDIDLSRVTSIGTSAFNHCGPNSLNFNFHSSISKNSRILACSPAYYDVIRPDAPEDTTSTSQYMEAYAQMQDILSGLDLDGKSDMEKVKAIYGWVTRNIRYDYGALDVDPSDRRYGYAGTIHSAIFARQAICHGYSILLKEMLNEAGVDCMYVSGPTIGGAHAWNTIRIDGKWYLCDSTWDAGNTDDDMRLITARYFMRSSTYFYDNEESGHFWPDQTDVYKALYPVSTKDYFQKIQKDGYTFMIDEDHAVLLKYKGKATSLTLPSSVTYEGADIPVTIIGRGAFEMNSRLEKIIIPEGYTTISEDAFSCCTFNAVELPSTLEKISANAFDYTDFLYNVKYNGTSQQFLAMDIAPGNNCLCCNTIHCSDGDYNDPRDLTKAKVTMSKKTYVYDGKSHLPDITVTLKGVTLEENKDYELKSVNYDYLKFGKKVAIYEIEIMGMGDYSRFSTRCKYRILPTPVKLKKLRAGKKTLTAYWTKKTTQVSGYQVQIALNKKFTKGKKTINVKGSKTVSLKIKKLKSRKRYYVRVRTRKYSYGDTIECNLYSSWSNVKSIKVK